MEAFVWDARFVTGLERVDSQHRHLVDLVNKVGDFMLESRGSEAELEAVFGELATYATEHFAEEERLMAEFDLDAGHASKHAHHHQDFVHQLTSMWARRHGATDPAAMLHGYLASWLTVHILGEDQAMARMIHRIEQGMTPSAAAEAEREHHDHRVSALLDALHKLYQVLSTQNRELAAANQSLEEKVEQRTSQLLQSEKMASLGRLVAGFAHEMNTPVGIAIGAVSQGGELIGQIDAMLGGEEVNADDLLARLDDLRQGNQLAASNLQRAAELVQRLKRSSIDQEAEGERPFHLRDVIEDVGLGLKKRLAEKGIDLQVDCPGDILLIGRPALYEQVLTALLSNALQHAFQDGRLGILRVIVEREGGQLRLICKDNGQGMPPEVAARIFEPFFTTSRSQGSTGLGMYLCYNIVTARLGGQIACQSEPGAGTTVTLSLPFAESQ